MINYAGSGRIGKDVAKKTPSLSTTSHDGRGYVIQKLRYLPLVDAYSRKAEYVLSRKAWSLLK